MPLWNFPLDPRRTALGIALFADALQIVLFLFFGEGALSPVDDLLDIAVAWALARSLILRAYPLVVQEYA